MVADSDARLTFACSTPSTLFRKRVIRFTHEAQVIPSTGKETVSIRGTTNAVISISDRSLEERVTSSDTGRGRTGRRHGPVHDADLPAVHAHGAAVVEGAARHGRQFDGVVADVQTDLAAKTWDHERSRARTRCGRLDSPMRRRPREDGDVAGAVATAVLVGGQELIAIGADCPGRWLGGRDRARPGQGQLDPREAKTRGTVYERESQDDDSHE